MKLFEYSAEHITSRQALALVHELEKAEVAIEFANRDPVFDNCLLLVVALKTNALVGSIRARIWELNGGLACDMRVITPAQLERLRHDYC